MTEEIKGCVARIFEDAHFKLVAGAGFLVDGLHVLTCAHVIRDALGLDGKERPGPDQYIDLDFPFFRETGLYRAEIVAWEPIIPSVARDSPFRRDLALLRLTEGPPLGSRAAQLARVENAWKHEFGAFGFPELSTRDARESRQYSAGVYAEGIIRDEDGDGLLQVDNLSSPGYVITRGFSGTPAWDATTRRIIGMVVAADDPQVDVRTARLLPAAALLEALPALAGSEREREPYRGLEAFREEDASFFFGRERVTGDLEVRVRHGGLTAVVGPSGSGKSSLVMAGLIPRLRQDADWLIVGPLRPGAAPFRSLAHALAPMLHPQETLEQQLARIGNLADALENDPPLLADILDRIAGEGGPGHILLIFDQFEELFTYGIEKAGQDSFLSGIVAASARRGGGGSCTTSVLLTLRIDFLAVAATHPEFTRVLQDGTFLLGAMDAAELHDAIQCPAKELGVTFEPGLIGEILDDVGTDPGDLPLLEFALTQLWRGHAGGSLRHQDYARVGRVEQALGQYAEEAFLHLAPIDQTRAEEIFLQLVQVGEDTEPARRIATREDIGAENWTVVSHLADVRLVVTQQRELAGGMHEDSVEVVHEALFRGWTRFRDLVHEHQAFLHWREQLERDRRVWEADGRDASDLLRGPRLELAAQWLQTRRSQLNHQDCDYIEQSVALAERSRREERERQERELLAARRLARSQTRLARVAGGAAITFGLALIAGALLLAYAVRQQSQAESEKRVAQSRQLAVSALSLLTTDPDLSLLLAARAGEIAGTAQAEDALRSALIASHTEAIWRVPRTAVRDAAFSPDGQVVAAATDDHTVRLWNVRSGKLLHILPHVTPWRSLPLDTYGPTIHFSPNGALLAAASADRVGRVWSASTGALLCVLKGHAGPIVSMNFSPDSRSVVTASTDGTVRVWQLPGGRAVAVLRGPTSHVLNASFSADGTKVVATDITGSVWVWDDTRGALLAREANSSPATIARFSADGRLLLATDARGVTRVWQAPAGRLLRTIRMPTSTVTGAVFSPAGWLVATSGSGGTTWIRDTRTGLPISTLRAFTGTVTAAAFSPDARLIATGGNDGTIHIWNTVTGSQLWVLRGHGGPVDSVMFSPDGKRLVSSSDDGTVRLWDVPQDSTGRVLRSGPSPVVAAVFQPHGSQLLTVHGDGTTAVWSSSLARRYTVLPGGAYRGMAVSYSADGKRIFIVDRAGVLRVFDAATRAVIEERRIPDTRPQAVALTSGGRFLIAVTLSGAVHVWRTDTADRMLELLPADSHAEPRNAGSSPAVSIGTVGASEVQTGAGGIQAVPLPVTAVTIGTLTLSPDGRYLAVSGSNGTAEVWDVRTLEPLSVLKGASQVDALAFSPQGAVIATGDDAGVIRVWDVTSGTLLAVFRGHTDYVNSVAFSDDGRLLVSAGADGTVRIWDAVTGDDLAVLGKADDSLSGVWTYAVNTAAFSDDRRGIVAGLADGTTHVYRCEVCGSLSDLLTLAQSRRVRDLSLLERERYLP